MPRHLSYPTQVREFLLPIAAMLVASRLCLLLVGTLTTIAFATDPADQSWMSYLCRFDCGWYLNIAQFGYSAIEAADQPGATNFAFFPLFPILIRFFSPIFHGNYLYCAVAIANLCFYAALVYVYLYARLLNLNRAVALLSVGLLCILPQSIAFSAAYSESLFLLLLVSAMYYLRRESYLAAGIAAALLSATRTNGIFFILFALVWVLRNGGFAVILRPWREPQKFVPIVMAPMGLFVFWGYCFAVTGDAFAFPSTELHGWGWHFSPPWENLPVMLRTGGLVQFGAAYSLAVFAISTLLLRQRYYEEFALCAALIVLMWSGDGAASLFRYWLVLFPIWIALARDLASRPILLGAVFSFLATFNGAIMCVWTLQKSAAL